MTDRQLSLRRAAVLFSLGRLLLFIAAALLIFAISSLAGHTVNGFPLLLAALVVSSVAGVALFSRQRAQFAEALAQKRLAKIQELSARRARLDDDSA